MYTGRKLLGHVAVDSGQLVILDPDYIESEWKRRDGTGEFGGGTHEECARLTLGPDHGGQLKFPAGHDGLGVVAQPIMGDGVYPVYADYVDGKVAALTVEFVEGAPRQSIVLEYTEDQEHTH